MSMYFECKVRVSTDTEKGVKKHNEVYLVRAVDVVDVKVKVTEEFSGYSGDWEITSIVKKNYVGLLD